MSAFLGPIHHWLYRKIQFQNQMVEALLTYANENYPDFHLAQVVSEKYGDLENKPLEQIIHTSNIHGWLQDKVSLVEGRLAYGVTVLLQKGASQQDLHTVFFDLGKAAAPQQKDAKSVFKYLNDTLLDGMPCDHANDVLSESDTEVTWKRNICVHKPYWDAVQGDVSVYYLLREALIEGMLAGSELRFKKQENNICTLGR